MINWLIALINKRQKELYENNKFLEKENLELRRATEINHSLMQSLVIKHRTQGDLINFLDHYQIEGQVRAEINRLRDINRGALDIGMIATHTIKQNKEKFNVK